MKQNNNSKNFKFMYFHLPSRFSLENEKSAVRADNWTVFAIAKENVESSHSGKNRLKNTRLWHNYQITTSNL